MATNTALTERPRHANQTPPALSRRKQQAFLQHLTTTGRLSQSCTVAQCSTAQPYEWAKRSVVFAKAFEEAKIAGEKVLLAAYEHDMDMTLLPEQPMNIDDFARTQNSRFFRMKRLDPAYRDNAVVNVNAVGPVAIQFNLNTSMQPTQAAAQAGDE
jgi:hypothetical protein